MMVKWRRPSISPRVLFRNDHHRREKIACILLLLFCVVLWHFESSLTPSSLSPRGRSVKALGFQAQQPKHQNLPEPTCAILLFGLPRAFPVVWPSLQRHVILPNAGYGCDYYVHAFDVPHEPAGRSGQGGPVDTQAALTTLQDYIQNKLPNDPLSLRHSSRPATIHVSTSTDEAFQTAHTDLLHRVETVQDEEGRSIYVPWKHENYEPSTTTNILKMWHSIQQAWQSMEEQVQEQKKNSYSRVAVLRWDVVYMTPVDIYQINATHRDLENTHVVLPGFAKYPVNDRGIYGPTDAVRVWATERFRHVDTYVQEYRFKRPGSGIHSERYLGQFLLPRMQSQFPSYTMVERTDWCFYRARADYSVWISDCPLPAHARRDAAVAYVTGCSCTDVQNRFRDVKEVTCCVDDAQVVT